MTNTISPFSLKNIRLFILFRTLFNARFYYPVFTILFLDYGLTLEQFALLNTVWAFTIVATEVPSGALADLIGRKRLMVSTSLLMILEMAIIAFIPLGDGNIIFFAFLVNRVLSGLAEAMSSGADEAMAYDTLVESGLEKEWSRVLDYQMRIQHLGYIFAMTLGAMVYDATMMNRMLGWLGIDAHLGQQVTMRFPVYLTLGLALLALYVTSRMRDPDIKGEAQSQETHPTVWQVFVLTFKAGGWILKTPFALAVILYAMVVDHTLRMLVTMTSQYYRLIDLPEACFGAIGSAVAVLGLFIPGVARAMAKRFSAALNALLVVVFSLTSLFLLTLFTPFWGMIPVMMLFIGLTMIAFFTSYYLHEITSSEQRATVLSFKGLAYNSAYGLIGMLYAGLITQLKERDALLHPQWSAAMINDSTFKESIFWFPWYLIAGLVLVSMICVPRLLSRQKKQGI